MRRNQADLCPTRQGALPHSADVLLVQACGEFLALAVGETAEGLAGRDPAVVERFCGFDPSDFGDREQEVEDLGGLQVCGWAEQQRGDRCPAGLEVAFELRAERADLVGRVECVDALIRAAFGCRRMLERVAVGHDNQRESTRASLV